MFSSRLVHLRGGVSSLRRWRTALRWLILPCAATTSLVAAKLYSGRTDSQRESDEREAAERRRHNESLMDVYGDRSSLQSLEDAVKFYEERRGGS
ncbi:hypothetical protein GQ602_004710 [Ophiocordyceps camponoti-floridani]|uniref:Uncharacterized protein n=1 Tax=Ophiocordyceps camponoti-floridani TaxID=2030778 RepID=A0A8H4VCA8_9HYPO|nr:hypothetical protein GQ602_004710 [Ophiocordyceps camponoti-floridani]